MENFQGFFGGFFFYFSWIFFGAVFFEDFLRGFFGGFFGRNSLFTSLKSAKLFESDFVKILSQWRRKDNNLEH